ncbi:MAG TPA: glycosyltransferase family 2 protein [Solirubrobacterales bacterium]
MELAPTVYVPTLEGGENLRRCLESLHGQTTRAEIVVADNGVGNGCAEMLAESFPEVTRVGFGRNLGFGRALNRAIAEAGEGPIILLNDDAVAEPGFVEAMVAGARDAELVAAVMLNAKDPTRIDSAGVIVDQTLMAFDYLSGASVSLLERASDPLGPTGGAALYDRGAFNAAGGFDERIFVYYEDVDLALRMRRQGADCVLAADARVVHSYSATLGARTGRKYAMTGWSRGYLLRRYGVMGSPSTAAQALCREVVVCAGQMADDRTTAGLRGRIRGWRDARGLPQRSIPRPNLIRLSLGNALAMRRKRHGT